MLILLQVGGVASSRVGTDLDAIQLSIFSHRFMSTAEQMGRSHDDHMTWYVCVMLFVSLCRVLQRTSISTNIKVGVAMTAGGAPASPSPSLPLFPIPPSSPSSSPSSSSNLPGASGLLLCTVRSRWWSCGQCSTHSCPPGGNAGSCAVSGQLTVM